MAEPGVLYRVGRAPDPLAPPPFAGSKNSGNRFDDPAGEFWVMYAAEQRRACFAETLARFRADLTLLAILREMPDGDTGDDTPSAGTLPGDWHLKRMVGRFRPLPGQRWLDLRDLKAREQLRRDLAATFLEIGLDDFDLSDALTRRRDVTQSIARWAYDSGHNGIAYTSRLDAAFDCWAVFEGAQIEVIDASAIARDDPDLLAVARMFGLRLAD